MKQRILFFIGAICLSVASAFGLSYGQCQVSGSESVSCGGQSTAQSQPIPVAVPVEALRAPVMQASADHMAIATTPVHTISPASQNARETASFAPVAPESEITEPRTNGIETAPSGMSVLYSDAPASTATQPRLSTKSRDVTPYGETAYIGVSDVDAVPDYLIGVYR
jgi:hypothetical protein